MAGLWDKEKKEGVVKQKFTSKELYNMLTQKQKEELPVLRIHYRGIPMCPGKCSRWETCGLKRVIVIKNNEASKVFSIRYNRKELLKHAIPSN